tara:strand:- start:309 stop:515 length:207 start_codon:yes stop_codon:yes gene_type:complete
MTNKKLHQILENALSCLYAIRMDMKTENADFYQRAILAESNIKTIQTAIDDIEWTDEEIDAEEARYDH